MDIDLETANAVLSQPGTNRPAQMNYQSKKLFLITGVLRFMFRNNDYI